MSTRPTMKPVQEESTTRSRPQSATRSTNPLSSQQQPLQQSQQLDSQQLSASAASLRRSNRLSTVGASQQQSQQSQSQQSSSQLTGLLLSSQPRQATPQKRSALRPTSSSSQQQLSLNSNHFTNDLNDKQDSTTTSTTSSTRRSTRSTLTNTNLISPPTIGNSNSNGSTTGDDEVPTTPRKTAKPASQGLLKTPQTPTKTPLPIRTQQQQQRPTRASSAAAMAAALNNNSNENGPVVVPTSISGRATNLPPMTPIGRGRPAATLSTHGDGFGTSHTTTTTAVYVTTPQRPKPTRSSSVQSQSQQSQQSQSQQASQSQQGATATSTSSTQDRAGVSGLGRPRRIASRSTATSIPTPSTPVSKTMDRLGFKATPDKTKLASKVAADTKSADGTKKVGGVKSSVKAPSSPQRSSSRLSAQRTRGTLLRSMGDSDSDDDVNGGDDEEDDENQDINRVSPTTGASLTTQSQLTDQQLHSQEMVQLSNTTNDNSNIHHKQQSDAIVLSERNKKRSLDQIGAPPSTPPQNGQTTLDISLMSTPPIQQQITPPKQQSNEHEGDGIDEDEVDLGTKHVSSKGGVKSRRLNPTPVGNKIKRNASRILLNSAISNAEASLNSQESMVVNKGVKGTKVAQKDQKSSSVGQKKAQNETEINTSMDNSLQNTNHDDDTDNTNDNNESMLNNSMHFSLGDDDEDNNSNKKVMINQHDDIDMLNSSTSKFNLDFDDNNESDADIEEDETFDIESDPILNQTANTSIDRFDLDDVDGDISENKIVIMGDGQSSSRPGSSSLSTNSSSSLSSNLGRTPTSSFHIHSSSSSFSASPHTALHSNALHSQHLSSQLNANNEEIELYDGEPILNTPTLDAISTPPPSALKTLAHSPRLSPPRLSPQRNSINELIPQRSSMIEALDDREREMEDKLRSLIRSPSRHLKKSTPNAHDSSSLNRRTSQASHTLSSIQGDVCDYSMGDFDASDAGNSLCTQPSLATQPQQQLSTQQSIDTTTNLSHQLTVQHDENDNMTDLNNQTTDLNNDVDQDEDDDGQDEYDEYDDIQSLVGRPLPASQATRLVPQTPTTPHGPQRRLSLLLSSQKESITMSQNRNARSSMTALLSTPSSQYNLNVHNDNNCVFSSSQNDSQQWGQKEAIKIIPNPYEYLKIAIPVFEPQELHGKWNWFDHYPAYNIHQHTHDCDYDNDQTWNIFNSETNLYQTANQYLTRGSLSFYKASLVKYQSELSQRNEKEKQLAALRVAADKQDQVSGVAKKLLDQEFPNNEIPSKFLLYGIKRNPTDQHSFDLHNIDLCDQKLRDLRNVSFHPTVPNFAAIERLLDPSFEWALSCNPEEVMTNRLLVQQQERILDYAYGIMYERYYSSAQASFERYKLYLFYLEKQRRYNTFTTTTQIDYQIPSLPLTAADFCIDKNPALCESSYFEQYFYAGQEPPQYKEHLLDKTTIPRFFVTLLRDATAQLAVTFVRNERKYVTYYPPDDEEVPPINQVGIDRDPQFPSMRLAALYLGAPPHVLEEVSSTNRLKRLELYKETQEEIAGLRESPPEFSARGLYIYARLKSRFHVKVNELQRNTSDTRQRLLFCEDLIHIIKTTRANSSYMSLLESPDVLDAHEYPYTNESYTVYVRLLKQAIEHQSEYMSLSDDVALDEDPEPQWVNHPSQAHIECTLAQIQLYSRKLQGLVDTARAPRYTDFNVFFTEEIEDSHLKTPNDKYNFFSVLINNHLGDYEYPLPLEIKNGTFPITHLGFEKYGELVKEQARARFPRYMTTQSVEYEQYIHERYNNHLSAYMFATFYVDKYLSPPEIDYKAIFIDNNPLNDHYRFDKAEFGTFEPTLRVIDPVVTKPCIRYRQEAQIIGDGQADPDLISGKKKHKRVRFGNVNMATIAPGPDISKAQLGVGLSPIILSIEVLTVDDYEDYQNKSHAELLVMHDSLRRQFWFNTFLYVAAMDFHVRLGNYPGVEAGNFIQALSKTKQNQEILNKINPYDSVYPKNKHDPAKLSYSLPLYHAETKKLIKDIMITDDDYYDGKPHQDSEGDWIFDHYFAQQEISADRLKNATPFTFRGQKGKMVSPTCYIFDPVEPWELFEQDSPLYTYFVDILCEYRTIHWNEHTRRNKTHDRLWKVEQYKFENQIELAEEYSKLIENKTDLSDLDNYIGFKPFKYQCDVTNPNDFEYHDARNYYTVAMLRFRDFNDSSNEPYEFDGQTGGGCNELYCNGDVIEENGLAVSPSDGLDDTHDHFRHRHDGHHHSVRSPQSKHKRHAMCSCAVIGIHCSNEMCHCLQGNDTTCTNPFGAYAFLDMKSALFNEKMLRHLATNCYDHVKSAYTEWKGGAISDDNHEGICYYGVSPFVADEAKTLTRNALFDQGLPLYAPQVYEDFNPIHQYNTISALSEQDNNIGPNHIDLKEYKWTAPRGCFAKDFGVTQHEAASQASQPFRSVRPDSYE